MYLCKIIESLLSLNTIVFFIHLTNDALTTLTSLRYMTSADPKPIQLYDFQH